MKATSTAAPRRSSPWGKLGAASSKRVTYDRTASRISSFEPVPQMKLASRPGGSSMWR